MAGDPSSECGIQITTQQTRAATIRELFGSQSLHCQWANGTLLEAVCRQLNGNSITSALPVDTAAGRSLLPEGNPDPERYYDVLARRVLPHSVNVGSTRCMAHMTTFSPDFVHELYHVLLALNQNLVKRDASNSFTVLEREALAMMHRLAFDLPQAFYDAHEQNAGSSLGMFCSGSTLANLAGLWIARNHALRGAGRRVETLGVASAVTASAASGAVFIGSALMHYSIRKSADLLGIGEDNVRLIPVDDRGRLQMGHCRETLQRCVDSGRTVIALVGVAGTTDYGSIDPLNDLADLAEEFGVHFHVDAAWGGALLFSRTHRHRLSGIERAQSITIDAHKQMYLPIGIGLLLLRDPQMAAVIQKSSDYILQDDSGDLGRHSVEGSRPGISLFLHAALHIIGRRGYENLVNDNVVRAAIMAREIDRRERFELLAEPETNIVLYRYIPASLDCCAKGSFTWRSQAEVNTYNTRLQQEQWLASRSAVSRTIMRHPSYADTVVALRAIVVNPLATDSDVCALLDDQEQLAQTLAAEPL